MRLPFIILTLCMISYLGTAQTDIITPLDTIILVSGKKMPSKVISVATSKVSFRKKGSNSIEDLPRKQIHKIIYTTGRVEQFNSLAFESVNTTDFKSVIITENSSDVDGLYALGSVEAKSGKNSRTAKSAEKSAIIKLQKKAAAMGGVYVLLNKNEAIGGYREIPTHMLSGVVYGFDPPKEKSN